MIIFVMLKSLNDFTLKWCNFMIKNLKPLIILRILLIFSLHFLHLNSCKTPAKAKEELIPLMQLPKELGECSGMVELDNQHFIALNDGGNKPYLYVFNK